MSEEQFDLFGPEVLGLKDFTSGESTRYALTGVCVEKGRAVVSDGKMLLSVPAIQVPAGEFPAEMTRGKRLSGRRIVPTDALKKAFSFVPKKSTIPCLNGVVITEEDQDFDGKGDARQLTRVTISGTDLETSGTVKTRIIEGTFPEIDAVIPKPEARPLKVSLAAGLLKRLTAFATKHGDKGGTINFGFNPKSGTDSVLFSIPLKDGERTATGVIMPLNQEANRKPEAPSKTEEKPAPAPAPTGDILSKLKKDEADKKPGKKTKAA